MFLLICCKSVSLTRRLEIKMFDKSNPHTPFNTVIVNELRTTSAFTKRIFSPITLNETNIFSLRIL